MRKKIAFLGGDKRELQVMHNLAQKGYNICAAAIPPELLPDDVVYIEQPEQALSEADAAILPVPPLRADGRLHSLCQSGVYLEADIFAMQPSGFPIITGVVSTYLRNIAAHCRLIGMMDSDELALPLAEATAEGTLAEAIALSDGLLFGSRAVVIGYGRIGRALAWRLDALGMEVVVINRCTKRLYEAWDYGLHAVSWEHLPKYVEQAQYVFNTVPAPVLNESLLCSLDRHAVVIDLASSPGGTDFEVAASLGIDAVLASGLPGKYCPRYAGEAMSDVYEKCLSKIWKGEE